MDLLSSDGLDIKEIHRWLAVVWFVVGGPLVLAALPVPALDPLRKLFFPVIRRGKLLRSNESAGEGLQRFTVPQSFFSHFYVVGLIWTTGLFFTSLGIAVTCARPTPDEHTSSSLASQLVGRMRTDVLGRSASLDIEMYSKEAWRLVFLLLIFEVHLTRRLYECLFVSVFDPSARMNLLGYIIAIGYYTALPLTLFLLSFNDEGFIKAFKGFLKHNLLRDGLQVTDVPTMRDIMHFLGSLGWMQYVGAGVCLYSSVHQYRCHEILASLRRDDISGQCRPPFSYKYGIPRGDWFEFVSSAHYLAEIGFYGGLLIASGANTIVMWILFVSVVANLYLLAKPSHEWYLSKFEDYPKTRHALFPSFRQNRAKD